MVFEDLFLDKIIPRCERKYVCSNLLYSQVLSFVRLNPACFSTPHPPRRVFNIYFDTDSYRNLLDVTLGLGERLKVRWRWYKTSFPGRRIQLEMKFKKNDLVFKKVYPFNFRKKISILRILRNELTHKLGFLPAKLLDAMRPVVFNCYRRYYFLSADGKIRLTLDTDLISKRIYSSNQKRLPAMRSKNQQTIIELKYSPSDEKKAEEVANKLPPMLSKSSKYANAFFGVNF